MVMLMLHQQLKRAIVQLTTQVHHAKNVRKVTVVHIHWLVFIWVNVGHAEHYVTNDRVNAIVKLENVRYVDKNSLLYEIFPPSNRIVKVIAKVIDANDAVLVMNLIRVAINVYNKAQDINHVCFEYEYSV